MSTRVDTLVIGAGISGLAYAHARATGTEVVVLEAADRAGGLVRTLRGGTRGEYRFEAGPEALRFEAVGELNSLFDELNLQAKRPPDTASKRFIVRGGRLLAAPMKPPQFLVSPIVSFRGKLRMAQEPWRDPRVGLDGSVADFVRHRLGQEALDALIDPLVSGIHAGDPEQLSMRACFPRLVELVEQHGSLIRALRATRGEPAPSVMKPDGGNQTLVDGLVAGLAGRLRLSTPVTSLERAGSQWRAQTPGGTWEATRIVLALPMRAASQLLAAVAPKTASMIDSIGAESVVSFIHAYRRADVAHPLDGFGYLVASSERLLHLGTLFSSSIAPGFAPDGEVLLRTFLGGVRHPELVEADDARLHEIVAGEVGPLLGLRAAPRWSAIDRYPAIFPRYDLKHPQRVTAIEHSLLPGLVLLGNYLRGIGVNHLVATARKLAREHTVAPADAVASAR